MEHLLKNTGIEHSAATIRKRIQRINDRAKEMSLSEEPLLKMVSTKSSLSIKWSQEALSEKKNRNVRESASQASIRGSLDEATKPEIYSFPQYQVFISHGWDENMPKVEKILDDFIKKLKSNFKNMP